MPGKIFPKSLIEGKKRHRNLGENRKREKDQKKDPLKDQIQPEAMGAGKEEETGPPGRVEGGDRFLSTADTELSFIVTMNNGKKGAVT